MDLLASIYPILESEIQYCAPELLGFKINTLVGVDIEYVTKIFNEYQKIKHGSLETLKKKFIQSVLHNKF